MNKRWYILIGMAIGFVLTLLRFWFINPSFVLGSMGIPILQKQCFMELFDEELCNKAVKEAKANRWKKNMATYWSKSNRVMRCIDILRDPELCKKEVNELLKSKGINE